MAVVCRMFLLKSKCFFAAKALTLVDVILKMFALAARIRCIFNISLSILKLNELLLLE